MDTQRHELQFFILHCYHEAYQPETNRWSKLWYQHEIMRFTLEEAIRVAEADAANKTLLPTFALERGDRVRLLQLICKGKVVHTWKKEKKKKVV
jgi:hypothetical protein